MFRLLRDGNFNSDTCIAHHSTSALPSANHHRFPLPPFDLSLWDFEFAVFPFPKVFRLLRDETPSSWFLHQEHRYSSSPRTVTSISSWYRGIPPLYIPLAIALLTPSPFCVTCLWRLAFEYCRQRYLCTLVIRTFYCIHTISYWYHIIPCVTRLFPYIQNCYLGLCISHCGHIKKKRE